jgi:hypothetical protein
MRLDDLDSVLPAFPGAGTAMKIEFFKEVWDDVCWCSTRIPLKEYGKQVLHALTALTKSDTRACTALLSYVLDGHQAVRMMIDPEFYLALLSILKRNGGNVVVTPELVEGWTRIIQKSGGYTNPMSLMPFEMRSFEFLKVVGQWVKQHVSLSNQMRLQTALDPSTHNKNARAWSQKIARAVPRIARSIDSNTQNKRNQHVPAQHAPSHRQAQELHALSRKIALAVPRIAKSINSEARYQSRRTLQRQRNTSQ